VLRILEVNDSHLGQVQAIISFFVIPLTSQINAEKLLKIGHDPFSNNVRNKYKYFIIYSLIRLNCSVDLKPFALEISGSYLDQVNCTAFMQIYHYCLEVNHGRFLLQPLQVTIIILLFFTKN